MNQLLEEKYKELGISEKVYAFGEKIEQELKERFEKITRRQATDPANFSPRQSENSQSGRVGKSRLAIFLL